MKDLHQASLGAYFVMVTSLETSSTQTSSGLLWWLSILGLPTKCCHLCSCTALCLNLLVFCCCVIRETSLAQIAQSKLPANIPVDALNFQR